MPTSPPAYRRLCLMVDVESYSRRAGRHQLAIQSRLAGALDAALRRVGVAWKSCDVQEQGDGFLLLLPVGVDEGRAVPGLVHGLALELARVNRLEPGDDARIRLRAALTQGAVRRAAAGYVAKAVVAASRIVGSPALRGALAAYPDRDLAVALTDDLYEDVIVDGSPAMAGVAVREADVRLPGKDFSAHVWVLVPDPSVGPVGQPGRPWPATAGRLLVGGEGVAAAGLTMTRLWAGGLVAGDASDHHGAAEQDPGLSAYLPAGGSDSGDGPIDDLAGRPDHGSDPTTSTELPDWDDSDPAGLAPEPWGWEDHDGLDIGLHDADVLDAGFHDTSL
ncbi:hypothetical protein MXD62_32300 [Frankia sp. Mgl5]|uniref:hypothetical protein n=1 Tax=Frankia sp. Mgl5 TaxID=2933793 RepID=UPI00200E90E6|nr:hypothetical protein [Frankia sp. Mgl5]MCK9931765.1 hypothetical protein [Frankia sp. Mgl5]